MLSFLRRMKSKYSNKLRIFILKFKKVYVNPASYIGEYTSIGCGTKINGPALIPSFKDAPVQIGKYCAIADNLRIRSRDHFTGFPNIQVSFQNKYGFPELMTTKKGGGVNIGNAVWIGDSVMILSGVKIGNGAVVGAGSVVTKDIPSYAIAAGNPAKIIKYRFNDTIISQLEEIKWWDWDEDKIKANRLFFSTDLSKLNDTYKINQIIL